MKKAVCPGSFCPVTNGHIDIFKRAAGLFDEVTVLVMANPDKHYDFSAEQRRKMIADAVAGDPRIRVDVWDGLLADYVEKNGFYDRKAGEYVHKLQPCSSNCILWRRYFGFCSERGHCTH